jgi:hypothetical protein
MLLKAGSLARASALFFKIKLSSKLMLKELLIL